MGYIVPPARITSRHCLIIAAIYVDSMQKIFIELNCSNVVGADLHGKFFTSTTVESTPGWEQEKEKFEMASLLVRIVIKSKKVLIMPNENGYLELK
jgi:hypothetical protein